MREELDKQLVSTYPRMFRNRYAPMNETCMCWGFEHGDGWYPIISALCANIQGHVEWKREQRARALLFNRARSRGRDALIKHLAGEGEVRDWHIKIADEAMVSGDRPVPKKVNYVVVDQVKEKFGTLRFYYHGGDEAVDGMVRMAESMSAMMCEKCSKPATMHHDGWVRTLCDEHEEEYQNRWTKMRDEDE